MSGLNQFMEFVVAGVFLVVGLRKIYSYRRRPLGADGAALPPRVPYGCVAAVGAFEVMAALALLAPAGPWPQDTVVRLAALCLAASAVVYGVYCVRCKQTAALAVVLFLLTMFVLVGRSI